MATNGKKYFGESALPHQLAIHDAVIKAEPAKAARPRASGGAIGLRKMDTPGSCWRMALILFSFVFRTAMIEPDGEVLE